MEKTLKNTTAIKGTLISQDKVPPWNFKAVIPKYQALKSENPVLIEGKYFVPIERIFILTKGDKITAIDLLGADRFVKAYERGILIEIVNEFNRRNQAKEDFTLEDVIADKITQKALGIDNENGIAEARTIASYYFNFPNEFYKYQYAEAESFNKKAFSNTKQLTALESQIATENETRFKSISAREQYDRTTNETTGAVFGNIFYTPPPQANKGIQKNSKKGMNLTTILLLALPIVVIVLIKKKK